MLQLLNQVHLKDIHIIQKPNAFIRNLTPFIALLVRQFDQQWNNATALLKFKVASHNGRSLKQPSSRQRLLLVTCWSLISSHLTLIHFFSLAFATHRNYDVIIIPLFPLPYLHIRSAVFIDLLTYPILFLLPYI